MVIEKSAPLLTLMVTLPFPLVVNARSAPATFAYVLQVDSLAKTKSAAVEQLAKCGRDWIVLDAT